MDEQVPCDGVVLCEGCMLDLPCDSTYMNTFSVYVCSDCRYSHPKFKLLTKDTVKKQYLLPDSVLQSLPCIRKANPKHEGFAQLRLYLAKSCESAAIELFGSLENVAEEKRTRECKRFEKAVKRTKNEVTRLGVYGKRRKDKFAPTRKPTIPVEEPDHIHVFQNEREKEDGRWIKECECGLTISVHKI